MKKILVVAPALSRSGYGEQARFALRALANEPERFDIYLQIINWGATPFLHEETEEYLWIKSLAVKTEQYARGGGQFDVSLQITIPNEWKRYAPVNIGYTAGIECNFISPKWYEPSMQMDKIIVPSEHAKSGFVNTQFKTQDGNSLKVTVPVEVVPFPAKIVDVEEFGFSPTTKRNFLSVCQWGPRKNVEAVLEAFYQEFKRESDVGLVLKINVASDCEIDRAEVRKRLQQFKERHAEAKCKVYMIHGDLSEGQLKSLYTHPTIKGYVTATHGEGFGLPIFEAAINELPVVAPDWSAYMDFMTLEDKPAFLTVKYQIAPVGDESIWEGVIEKGTSWCYPILNSLKARMRELLDTDYTRFKSRAKKLSAKILETHKQEDLFKKFNENILKKEENDDFSNFSNFYNLN